MVIRSGLNAENFRDNHLPRVSASFADWDLLNQFPRLMSEIIFLRNFRTTLQNAGFEAGRLQVAVLALNRH